MTKQEFASYGIDSDEGLQRFLNQENIYIKFLKKFPDDPSYQEMLKGIEEENIEVAFQAAHTLKGVSGNLALTKLHQATCTLVEQLRMSDMSHLDESLPPVKEAYEQVMACIHKL